MRYKTAHLEDFQFTDVGETGSRPKKISLRGDPEEKVFFFSRVTLSDRRDLFDVVEQYSNEKKMSVKGKRENNKF